MTDTEPLNFALGQLDRTQAFHGRVVSRVAALLVLNLAMASITSANLTTPILAIILWMGFLVGVTVQTGALPMLKI
jgi:hypothetical protein